MLNISGNSIRITEVSGDVTRVKSDAIITAINSGGLWFGGIDGAIHRVAGDIYHNQAAERFPLLDLDVIVAKGNHEHHRGNFDNVVFVVDDLESLLRNVIMNGLIGADNAGYKTISIPAIRTGVMLGSVEKSLHEVVQEWIIGIELYAQSIDNIPSIENITFVIYNNPMLEELLRRALSHKGWL